MVELTWSEYSARHSTARTEDVFNRLYPIAAQRLAVFTARRAAIVDGYKADAVKECLCNMVDYLAVVDQTGQGCGIASVSNDGYAQTFDASTPKAVDGNLRSIAFSWLSGTGLMGAV